MSGFIRKVIRIRATDSPNVAYGLAQEAAGIEPTDEILVPGVLSYSEYKKRLLLWDAVQKRVSLEGDFWEGADTLLFPPEWLDLAEAFARKLRDDRTPRRAKAMGVDPGEGAADSCWVVGDELGVVDVVSKKTADTTEVPRTTLQLIMRYGLDPAFVAFDRGGGGKQHADALRAMGYAVRTVGFGETLAPDPKRHKTQFPFKMEHKELRYAYVSRRAEMYDILSRLLDPALNPRGFAIPPWVPEVRRQLAPIPRQYDDESRMKLPPKSRPSSGPGSKVMSLTDMIGRSPDQADALVLMAYALHKPAPRARAGAM